MSCRFCRTEKYTVRVVAHNAVVTYGCGTSFFTTDYALGEDFDRCWSQADDCDAKAKAAPDGEREIGGEK